MSVIIKLSEKSITVNSPYHPDMPHRAKQLGGKFLPMSRCWVFDIRDEERVRALCMDIYGEDGRPQELITLRCVVCDESVERRENTIYIAGREVANAVSRDSGADLGECVVVIEGVLRSGGSRNNPRVTYDEGTVIEVRDLPKCAAERALSEHAEYFTVVDRNLPDRNILEAEKASLLARLNDIEGMLS